MYLEALDGIEADLLFGLSVLLLVWMVFLWDWLYFSANHLWAPCQLKCDIGMHEEMKEWNWSPGQWYHYNAFLEGWACFRNDSEKSAPISVKNEKSISLLFIKVVHCFSCFLINLKERESMQYFIRFLRMLPSSFFSASWKSLKNGGSL